VVLQADAVFDAFVAVQLCLGLLAHLTLHAQRGRGTKQAGPLTWLLARCRALITPALEGEGWL
jgi:hypothetical protein